MSTQADPTDPPRRRRWLRRLAWLLALAVVARLALGLAAGPIARAVAAGYGLDLRYERLELELLKGHVELWRLETDVALEGEQEPQALLSVQTLALDVDVTALFRGHVRVRRLELDGARVELARRADGTWNFTPLLARLAGDEAPPPEPERAESDEPGPIVLEPPFEVVAARLQDVSVHVRDAAADPPVDTVLTLSLAAVDIGSPGRRARLDVLASSPEVLGLLRVRGSAAAVGASADVQLDVELASLRLRPLAPLLEPLGLEPLDGPLDGGLALRLEVSPANEGEDRVTASLHLQDARLSHAGREALALDALTVDVGEAWAHGAHVRELAVDGIRARALRLSDGAPALAGIAWRGVPPGRADAAPSAPEAGSAAPPPQEDTATPFAWTVATVRVQRGRAVLEDRALAPAIELEALLEELVVWPLSSSADAPGAQLALTTSLPDIVERIELTGTLRPFAEPPVAALTLDAHGIGAERVAPYLALFGAEPALQDGSLRIQSIELGAAEQGGMAVGVRKLALTDAGQELGAIDSIAVTLAPAAPPHLSIGGTRLKLTREESDTLAVLGLRLGASPTPPREAQASSSPDPGVAEEPSPFTLPRLELPAVELTLEELLLVDEATGAAPHAIGPLTIALAPAAGTGPETRAWELALDGNGGAARELSATALLEQEASGALRVAGSAEAREIDLEPLRAWLALAGLEPALSEGAFRGAFALALAARDGRPALQLELGPLQLSQGGAQEREWLGLERLVVENLLLGSGVTIDDVRLAGPRIAFQRDADGGFRALGLRVPPPRATETATPATDAPKATEEPTAAPQADASVSAAASAAVAENGDPLAPEPPASVLRIERLQLSGARVRFDDLALATPHVLELEGNLQLDHLAPGVGAEPTAVDGQLGIGAWLLSVRGDVVLDPGDLRASLVLAGEGLCGEPLAPYLPPGIDVTLHDGRAAARLEARLARATGGGHDVTLRVEDVDLRERGAEHPLAALSALRVAAPRLDPALGVFEVEEVAVEGAALGIVRTADGGLGLFGLQVGGGAEPREPEATVVPATAAEPPARASAANPWTASRLRLERFDLQLTELRVTNEAFPDAQPSVSAARVSLREPLRLDLDPDVVEPELPVVGLDLTASVVPGVEALELALELAPFAERPRIDAAFAVRGIDAAGLLALAPELAADIDPAELTEGTFDATLGGELSFRRRSPLDFDLGAGFGAELVVRDVALRQAPEAEVALGVDAVQAIVRRIAPRSGLVHVADLEVDTPRARVRRTAEGVEVAGLVLRVPQPGAEPSAETDAPVQESSPGPDAAADQDAASADDAPTADAPTADAPTADAPTADAPTADAPTADATGAFRLDRFLVQGVDVRLEDLTVDPTLVVPLDALDVEVLGFETRALTEPVPIRFSAAVGTGTVPVPERLERTSLLRGVASGMAGALASSDGEEEVRFEDRPLFEEASLSGRLTLAPLPKGWVRLSLTAFELPALRGPARQGGVEIGDGLLDFRARVRLDGEQGGSITSLTNFTDLSLSEPDGGPISRYLKLPAPLDPVLFALKNERGEHRIPLDFDLGQGGEISTASIAAQASATLLGLITEALASAPVRAVGGATDIVGLGGLFGGGEGGPEYAGRMASIRFAAGDVHVRRADALDEILAALAADPLLDVQLVHLFGPEDLVRAERLASPQSSETKDLLRSLRLRRTELIRQRDDLAVLARSQLLLGQDEEFAATQRLLLAADRDLGQAEDGIDLLAELLRAGAENRHDRRTREAALAIAAARLEAVQLELLDGGVSYERCDLRPPRYELSTELDTDDVRGCVVLVTRGGTPPKGFFRRMLGWIGF